MKNPYITPRDEQEEDAMTLRDYFAAKAMVISPNNFHETEANAKFCYKMADAMLKEREN